MRKYIDLINEFQMLDVEKHLTTDGGGDMPPIDGDDDDDGGGDDDDDPRRKKIEVFDILWDVEDDERATLPTRVITNLYDVEEEADPYADEDVRHDLMHMIGCWLMATYSSGLSNFDFHTSW